MQKVICKKVYDTENSTFIKKVTFGDFGRLDGWEECLFQTESGHFFLYVNGGKKSKHPKEDITRLSVEKKNAWLQANA